MAAPRLATAADVSALATLYANTAHTLGHGYYSGEQVQAWGSFAADLNTFADYVLSASTWIHSQDDGQITGFCGVGPGGEVHSLYVRADCTRQGLGSQMLAHALAAARSQGVQHFAAWVTPFSRPVFERAGFVLLSTRVEPFQGVLFERYRVALA